MQDKRTPNLTIRDHKIIALAQRRVEVEVRVKDHVRRARLLAWCPQRPNGTHRTNKARVQYATGAVATVNKTDVTFIEGLHEH